MKETTKRLRPIITVFVIAILIGAYLEIKLLRNPELKLSAWDRLEKVHVFLDNQSQASTDSDGISQISVNGKTLYFKFDKSALGYTRNVWISFDRRYLLSGDRTTENMINMNYEHDNNFQTIKINYFTRMDSNHDLAAGYFSRSYKGKCPFLLGPWKSLVRYTEKAACLSAS